MAEMGKEKVTWMKLKTEPLNSEKNFTKVRKALCSTPQVRDQKFDEANNTVTIKVVCCSPEKVMNKLCSKGRGAIKLIETIDPPKPPAQNPKEAEKPKEPEKPKPAPAPAPTPAPAQAQSGPSSQPATMIVQAYNPASMIGQPAHWYNGPNGGWYQHNGYDQRSINEEEEPSCSIM